MRNLFFLFLNLFIKQFVYYCALQYVWSFPQVWWLVQAELDLPPGCWNYICTPCPHVLNTCGCLLKSKKGKENECSNSEVKLVKCEGKCKFCPLDSHMERGIKPPKVVQCLLNVCPLPCANVTPWRHMCTLIQQTMHTDYNTDPS